MRYLPHTDATRQLMCDAVGVASVDALFDGIAPQAAAQDIDLPDGNSEWEVERAMQRLARRNKSANTTAFFIGGGVYNHHIPASVDALIQRGEFLTSYTPYQPEVAQGTLQYLFEFQTMLARLTGMDVANASLYDGSNAAVEAVLMAQRVTKRKNVLLSGNLHPHYRQTIETYARHNDTAVTSLPFAPSGEPVRALIEQASDQLACVVVQYPDFCGHVSDFSALAQRCRDSGTLLIAVVTEMVSLGALQPPGDWGADIVVAEGQSLGVPMSYGGPHVGLFACRKQYLRQMPGRLCGQTVDADGKRSFVLTLSTREQHIRREKATSNICTNSGLCALAFTIHLGLLGGEGLARLAALNHAMAGTLADELATVEGLTVLNRTFFNEFVIRLPVYAAALVEELAAQDILAGVPLSRFYEGQDDLLLLAATEMNTIEQCQALAAAIRSHCEHNAISKNVSENMGSLVQ